MAEDHPGKYGISYKRKRMRYITGNGDSVQDGSSSNPPNLTDIISKLDKTKTTVPKEAKRKAVSGVVKHVTPVGKTGGLLGSKSRKSQRIAINTSFSKFKNTSETPVVLDEPINDSDDDFQNPPPKKLKTSVVNVATDNNVVKTKKTVARKPVEEVVKCDEVKSKITTTRKVKQKPKENIKEPVQHSTLGYSKYTGAKISLRSSPNNIALLVSKLTSAQRASIKEIGFGSILGWHLDSVPSGMGHWLVDNYDASTCILNVGSHIIHITPSLVHRLFGIPMGKKDVEEIERPRTSVPAIAEWRGQFEGGATRTSPKLFREYMETSKESGRIFKLNFLVLFNTIMGCTTRNNSVNLHFLKSLNPGVEIQSLNWCKYMISCLNKQMSGWGGEDKSFHGPLVLLAFALVDDQCLFEKIDGSSLVDKVDKEVLKSLALKLETVKFEELLAIDEGGNPVQRFPFSRDNKFSGKQKENEEVVLKTVTPQSMAETSRCHV